jgi:hypothetical protein
VRKKIDIEDRAFELWCKNPEWSMLKALSAAQAEEYRKRKVREGGKHSVRQIGWLEYT